MTDNDLFPIDLNEDNIKDMIYEIRGQKVMMDFDLARIYGYETKRFNEQIKNNLDKFPDRYRFKLTKEEMLQIERTKKSTSVNWTEGRGGRAYLPYAFTQRGVYMVMTVVRGELATRQTIALIDTFDALSNFLLGKDTFITDGVFKELESRVESNSKDIKALKRKMENRLNIPKKFLILNGERIEGSLAYESIFKSAKRNLYIVDDYISRKTLHLLKVCNPKVAIVLFTMNKTKELSIEDIDDFIKDTNMNIELKKNGDIFHGRFIFIDYGTKNYRVFRCGPSIKDAGNKIDTIDEEENKELYNQLIAKLINEN